MGWTWVLLWQDALLYPAKRLNDARKGGTPIAHPEQSEVTGRSCSICHTRSSAVGSFKVERPARLTPTAHTKQPTLTPPVYNIMHDAIVFDQAKSLHMCGDHC